MSKERLAQLKKRNEELKLIVFVVFKTKEEALEYEQTIPSETNEYYSNLKEIEQIEWDMKTPEEQETIKEYEKLYKLKREGKLYDYLDAKRKG
mmetsp:Transcript_51978/g.165790  ORF Transcript_51978/g.165790 Transcript_51978/m.165790 type:complete len:93 (+) Transcript_51978:247-525(+)|eukprot:CAMPEP_0182877770 /NCGR_PEP_ID=MMETSP0034_2-20130328/14959_1 /TAXON_ID=156128 /ORGANISM="Nephroselmis pyriformis, Strain CCMP717" /LENGTH=92 /DNA_ID=CAMNT_0025010629 /DNA_START=228 /DNA_END=506 /DNA_ORIENTATION=+